MKMMEVRVKRFRISRPRNCDGVAARRAYPEPGPSNYASGAPNDLVAGRLPVVHLGVVI